ncbi:MAG: metallophosphoesterase [Clostridia bacterium]|nr:metallophosphoesterase [Clostridia bacterium]
MVISLRKELVITRMKRILVFSDTHDDLRLCRKIIKNIPSDLIIHSGDYVSDAQRLRQEFTERELLYVKGNCDMLAYAPDEEIVELGGVKIYIVHGHRHSVKFEDQYKTLARAAREAGCRAAVFGHTHVSYCRDEDGLLLLNPGSSKYGGSYGVIEIENEEPSACVIHDQMMF